MFLSFSGSTKTRPTEAVEQIATVPRATVHRSTRAQDSSGPALTTPRGGLTAPSNSGIILERFGAHACLASQAASSNRWPSSQASPRALPQVCLPRPPGPRGNMLIINRVVFLVEEAGMGSTTGPLPPSSHVNLNSIWAPCQGRKSR